jgi:cellulose synthase/poly-beta-1,6-N-acetylglucosamine synthase-like glycosyltransferase
VADTVLRSCRDTECTLRISVIIPAYNEEKLLPGCLAKVFAALHRSACQDCTAEVIVVDNNSTDRTADLARAAGAAVVFEPINQISRARNAGAHIAQGDWFLFIDADSYLHPATLAELVRRVQQGHVAGGGCLVALDKAPPIGHFFIEICNLLMRTLVWAAGSFVFCRADAFREIGGFSTELYAAEEIQFSQDLKRWGTARGLGFALLHTQRHISSGRKFYLYSWAEILQHLFRGLVFARPTLRDKTKLDLFYDGRR